MKVNIDNEKSLIGLEKKEAKRILELFNGNSEYAKTFVHELIRLIDDWRKSNFYINVLNYI